MLRLRGVRRSARASLALIALAVALLLAGCGGAGAIGGAGGAGGASSAGGSGSAGGTGGTGGTGGSATATATPNLPPPCSGQFAAPSSPPGATLRNASGPNEVSLPVGAVVEIRLDGSHTWSRSVITPAGGVTPTGAQGALEQGDCVWDFTVARPGDTVISFAGGARCAPHMMCPQYALLAKFTVHGM